MNDILIPIEIHNYLIEIGFEYKQNFYRKKIDKIQFLANVSFTKSLSISPVRNYAFEVGITHDVYSCLMLGSTKIKKSKIHDVLFIYPRTDKTDLFSFDILENGEKQYLSGKNSNAIQTEISEFIKRFESEEDVIEYLKNAYSWIQKIVLAIIENGVDNLKNTETYKEYYPKMGDFWQPKIDDFIESRGCDCL